MAYRARVVVPFHTKFISTADLRAVGDEIKQRDPTLLWSPFEIKSRQSAADFRQRDLPAMLIQFHASSPPLLPQFKGPRFGCMPIHKATQLKMLKEAGLPVPAWTRLEPKAEVDPAVFGEYLIIKPTEKWASLGRGITLIRTADFNAYRDRHAGEYVSEERSQPLVQQFIQTGDNPLQRHRHAALISKAASSP